jgi:hypothetical protein
MWINKSEEPSLRANIVAKHLPEWATCLDKLKPGFEYIEDRLTDKCEMPYHMAAEHEIVRLAQFFDPDYAASHTDCLVDFVSGFSCIPAFRVHNLLNTIHAELPPYVIAVKSFVAGSEKPPAEDDMKAFTTRVLGFWARNHRKLPFLAIAARIVFSWTPNSAACERVFSLLKAFFGTDRDASLADQISVALKLSYNERRLG